MKYWLGGSKAFWEILKKTAELVQASNSKQVRFWLDNIDNMPGIKGWLSVLYLVSDKQELISTVHIYQGLIWYLYTYNFGYYSGKCVCEWACLCLFVSARLSVYQAKCVSGSISACVLQVCVCVCVCVCNFECVCDAYRRLAAVGELCILLPPPPLTV